MYERLFEPLTLGSVEIPNRIVRAAHGTSLPWVDDDDALIDYHEARARGGVGLIFLERGGVHAASSGLTWPFYDERIVAGCRRIADAVHQHRTKIFTQIVHRGSSVPTPDGVLWSSSEIPNPTVGVIPIAMTKTMIDEVIAGFAMAAHHAKLGGMDGVEIQGAHGYLIAQFLSPATNLRTDDYGGPLENRLRFLSEVISAVRASAGPGFPIGVRLSADDEIPGGLRPDDTATVVKMIEDQVDFISLSLGSYYRYHRMMATMEDPLGYELPASEVVTRVSSRPTIVSGRLMTLDLADHIVEAGIADAVSMVRALIADPELVNKARSSREAEIRPCIGSSQGCVGRPQGRIACVVNPAVGHEATIPFEPQLASTPRHVMVVGGGPAGMEAARTAALRGHEVELYETRNSLGGQVSIAANAPRRADFGAITQWLAGELERLNVKVRLRSPVDDDIVIASGAEVVVVATGSVPRRDGFQASRPANRVKGCHLPHVLTSWDILASEPRIPAGTRAAVYDDTGRFDALSVAEALIERGLSITFVSSHESLGARVPAAAATTGAARERILAAGASFLPNAFIDRIEKEYVFVGHTATEQLVPVQADLVVLVGYNEPERGLAELLEQHPIEVHVVGDAAGKTSLREAISDANALARLI